MKKRKKNVVGWVSNNWFRSFCNYYFTPTPNEMLQIIPFAEPKYNSDVKVRITIEEI